jgi:hypothetical protein
MLLDDDIVTDGEAEAGALAGWLGCEEGIEHPYAQNGVDSVTPVKSAI